MKHIFVMGATAVMLLLQAPEKPKQAIVDAALDLGAVAAIAEYIDRNGGED